MSHKGLIIMRLNRGMLYCPNSDYRRLICLNLERRDLARRTVTSSTGLGDIRARSDQLVTIDVAVPGSEGGRTQNSR